VPAFHGAQALHGVNGPGIGGAVGADGEGAEGPGEGEFAVIEARGDGGPLGEA